MANTSKGKRGFKRGLKTDLITKEGLSSYPLLAQLLDLWSPSGHDSDGGKRLRLFIRDGYVNFYTQGQSLFKVSFRKDNISFGIHQKYICKDASSKSQKLETIDGHQIPEDLPIWQDRALNHPSKKKEKVFVDDLLNANPDVIDAEAALPGFHVENGDSAVDKAVAPRMDIVMLEPSGDGYRLVFWEAKLSQNPEIRVKGSDHPKVVEQLRKYEEWLTDGDHQSKVIEAYTQACRMLVALHSLAKNAPSLGEAIVAVGSGESRIVGLDPKIRLVICVDRNGGGKGGSALRESSFIKNGHAKKLLNKVHLQLIEPEGPFLLESKG